MRKGFSIIEADISKYREEAKQTRAEDDFNSLSMVYQRNENTFIKNYDYFISMRNKELGLIEPPAEEEDEEEQPESNNLGDFNF